MSHINPVPFFLWTGAALIAFDQLGLTAAGLALIGGGLLSGLADVIER